MKKKNINKRCRVLFIQQSTPQQTGKMLKIYFQRHLLFLCFIFKTFYTCENNKVDMENEHIFMNLKKIKEMHFHSHCHTLSLSISRFAYFINKIFHMIFICHS